MVVMNARDLYERDFFEWTRCNAALLRAGRFHEADLNLEGHDPDSAARD